MFTYIESTQTFFIDTLHTTYAFRITAEKKLEHLYYGTTIHHDDLAYSVQYSYGFGHDAQPQGTKCENLLSNEVPTFGHGDYREPMIQLTSETGDCLSEFCFDSYKIENQSSLQGLPSTYGGTTLHIYMVDAIKKVSLDLMYTIFKDADLISRTWVLTNNASAPYKLNRAYSFAVDLPQYKNMEALSFYGSWANERTPERVSLHHGVWSIDSNRGCSSNALSPSMIICDHDTTEFEGHAWGVTLVYSGSYRLFAEIGQHHTLRLGGGISEFNFEWNLKPGDSFTAPEALIGFSNEGLSKLSHGFHDGIRFHLMPHETSCNARPILINNWEATYFDFTPKKLCDIMDSVAGTGIDTFVLDDGWFGVRNNDKSGLGDWYVNTDKLPGGLTPIIDYCHSKGLRFGLWFEPEMVNPNSDLYRAHPEYAIQAPGHVPCESRNQYCLDLTRQDVRDYIVSSVNRILDTHEIDYVKWDYNRAVTEFYSLGLDGSEQKEFAHRYMLGLYDLFERIVNTHKKIFFEGCSSGGARFDCGILAYFPQIWTSDDTDAVMRTRIQYGTSFIFPLSSMSCHTSISPNHQTGRSTSIKTRSDIAHLGATGYELDASTMPKEELEDIPRQIEEYHKIEKLVLLGDMYRLCDPFNSNYFCMELIARDRSEVYVVLLHTLRVVNCEPLELRLRGLDPNALYTTEDGSLSLHGSTLMSIGLAPHVGSLKDFETLVWHFKKQ